MVWFLHGHVGQCCRSRPEAFVHNVTGGIASPIWSVKLQYWEPQWSCNIRASQESGKSCKPCVFPHELAQACWSVNALLLVKGNAWDWFDRGVASITRNLQMCGNVKKACNLGTSQHMSSFEVAFHNDVIQSQYSCLSRYLHIWYLHAPSQLSIEVATIWNMFDSWYVQHTTPHNMTALQEHVYMLSKQCS